MQTQQTTIDPTLEAGFDRIAARAKADGADAELLVERSESLKLSTNEGRLEKFESSQSNAGGIRVVFGGVEGYCWTESLAAEDLEAAYKEALENAKFAARGRTEEERKKDAVELYAPTKSVQEDPSLFNDSLGKVSIDEKIERAKQIEAKAKAVDSRISSVPYNGYSESFGEAIVMNTKGVRARQRQTSVAGYAYCLAKQGEESRMAGDFFVTRDAQKMGTAEIERLTKRAAEDAISKLGAVSPETGMYPIVIDREVASEFFGLMSDYFSGKSVAEKTSLFKDDLGKPIASPLLSIVDDPFLPDGIANQPFDAEGAPTQKTPMVVDGVLKNFLTNSVYSRRLKLPHTASAARSAKGSLDIGISNMVIAAGKQSFEELMASVPKAIYITNFTGYHAGFNEGSGTFSLQSEGELWENGKRVKALTNFVVAGSVRELLMGIQGLSSRHCDKVRSVVAPDILIQSLSVAG